jgi:CRP/FNR family transcriptional regulator
MAESKDFQNYIMRAMASCLTESMQMVADVSFQRLELRLACLIGKLCQMKSSNKLKVTHQEIANELGTTREVVSRILKDFEHMGCIQLNRGSIEILSGETLQRITG